MDPLRTISTSALVKDNNGSTLTASPVSSGARIGEVKRVTKETNVSVKINLDGTGVADNSTGISFLDHLLDNGNSFVCDKFVLYNSIVLL